MRAVRNVTGAALVALLRRWLFSPGTVRPVAWAKGGAEQAGGRFDSNRVPAAAAAAAAPQFSLLRLLSQACTHARTHARLPVGGETARQSHTESHREATRSPRPTGPEPAHFITLARPVQTQKDFRSPVVSVSLARAHRHTHTQIHARTHGLRPACLHDPRSTCASCESRGEPAGLRCRRSRHGLRFLLVFGRKAVQADSERHTRLTSMTGSRTPCSC